MQCILGHSYILFDHGGQNTMGRGSNISWVWGPKYHGRGFDIPWIRGQYNMDRGFDIPWVVGSKYHG